MKDLDAPLSREPLAEEIEQARSALPHQVFLDKSIYSIQLPAAGQPDTNLFEGQQGKVTLIFNVAGGCGNIPQHEQLERINKLYGAENDFSVIAVVVDDFTCHGYPDFQDGLASYAMKRNLSATPGEVAKLYAIENFGVTYEFSEITNGRIDKHRYDESWIPNDSVEQEIHPLWKILTEYDVADLREDGIPIHQEHVPWVEKKFGSDKNISSKPGRPTLPLSGNFTKFLIDRTGRRIIRYGNGFLLGERDVFGQPFPWWPEHRAENGEPSHLPRHLGRHQVDIDNKKLGIDLSVEILSNHIDNFLQRKI